MFVLRVEDAGSGGSVTSLVLSRHWEKSVISPYLMEKGPWPARLILPFTGINESRLNHHLAKE